MDLHTILNHYDPHPQHSNFQAANESMEQAQVVSDFQPFHMPQHKPKSP